MIKKLPICNVASVLKASAFCNDCSHLTKQVIYKRVNKKTLAKGEEPGKLHRVSHITCVFLIR